MLNTKVAGVGHYAPSKVMTNADLEKVMDTSDAWITERTGIKERHYANVPEETTSWMGAKAAEMALERANLTSEDVDMIIFATLSPEHYFPGSGCFLHQHMNFKNNVPALDIRVQCSGFVYGLQLADSLIKTGTYRCILLVGSEIQSTAINLTTEGRDIAVIFGDGAGAAVLVPTENKNEGILSHALHAEGSFAKELWCDAPGSIDKIRMTDDIMKPERKYPYMNGRYVFKHAVTRFPEVIQEALAKVNLTISDIDLLIPHQANKRITDAIGAALNLSEDKVFSNIHKYGNTTAASIPIAWSEAISENRLKRGDLLVLAAFGSGFTWGSVVIKY